MQVTDRWTGCFLAVMSIVRATMGAYTALSGPTLLYLAKNVEANVYQISTMFSGRAFGTLAGSIWGGVLTRFNASQFKELLLLGFALGVLALTEVVVPWIENLWLLIVDVIIGGIVFGYLDAGIQAVILRIWGEKRSRSYVQIYHLSYSVGAFLLPFLANSFLAKANVQSTTRSCPSSNGFVTTTPSSRNTTTTCLTPAADFNPVGWTYIILASMIFAASLLFVLIFLLNIEARIVARSEKNDFKSEDRSDEPIRDVFVLFLLVVMYYFCSTTTENVYYNYIYAIAICSDFQFTISQASRLTSIFWLGFGLGRGTGVVASKHMQPKTIISLSIIGSILDMTLMVTLGQHSKWMPWILTASHGFTTSMLYPSGVSLVSQMTNISGRYMFICNVGNAFGSLSMLLLAGYIYNNVDPFSVMYLILGLSVLNAVFFAGLVIVGKSRLRSFKYRILSGHVQQHSNEGSVYGSSNGEKVEC